MANYISITNKDKESMLEAIGVKNVEELFEDIPKILRAKNMNLPKGKSQQETYDFMKSLAKKNKLYESIFMGAGSYNHFIPSVVKNLSSRSEFVTAYTPYQAELSQGILQAMFEYQTMICNLTGMNVSNASHYSGAVAAAEACIMSGDKNKKIITFDNINPDTMDTLRTYLSARNIQLEVISSVHGKAILCDEIGEIGGVYVENPNYFGLIENVDRIGEIAHANGGKLIVGANPIALGIMKTPRACGADIAVGEAQPLGLSMSFGGAYLGYLAVTTKEMRKVPGRIVGETTDRNGEKAYVLTMQTREQHIRREKATSNICSNEAHCALTAAIYLSALGASGLREVATACMSNAHYLASSLVAVGAELKYDGEFFHEFVTVTKGKAKTISATLDKANILSGLPLDDDQILWCCTEMSKKDDMDKVIKIVESCTSMSEKDDMDKVIKIVESRASMSEKDDTDKVIKIVEGVL